jgi:uncharacterized ferritin-like protein (DUF455 family)
MTSIHNLAEQVLAAEEVDRKLALTQQAGRGRERGQLTFEDSGTPLPFECARFPPRPVLVDPRDLPKRKPAGRDGRIALLHAVAHIEFSAIQLAWDHLHRFRGLPEDYYRDWLGVALEEAEHFTMVRARLREWGAEYGDLPAHGGLWSIARDTAHDVGARMALVPRFMEARGLDVTPGMIAKLQALGDHASAAVLTRILEDEVGHVALGSRWFEWICQQRGVEPETEYFALIDRYLRGQARGPFNLELRKRAGFRATELDRLVAEQAPT